MPRRSTGKRQRFNIFKRDGFTCQYCGAQPPAAVLVVDHIHPVSEGGPSDDDNLITSCEACNQGKAAKLLGDRAIRPDADMMYLETQQEIAELARYRQALVRKQSMQRMIAEDLSDMWIDLSGQEYGPELDILVAQVDKHGPQVVEDAVRVVASKVRARKLSMRGSGWLKYFYGVLRNLGEGPPSESVSNPDEGSPFGGRRA